MVAFLRISLILILASVLTQSYGQDIHFSQFYASPLNLNPALTGYSEGDYRVAGIYRNQWNTVTTPYVTYGASYDMRLLKDKLKKDVFGVGGSFVSDRSGNGKIGLMSMMVSAAYHKQLGKKTEQYLGLGIQLGYVQRSLSYESLTFPSQHNGSEFDTGMSNGENFDKTTTGYFDMQVGLMWSTRIKERVGIFAGVTAYHLTRPKESFLGDDTRLEGRYAANMGLRVKVTKRFYVTPNAIFMFQNKAQQFNFGTGLEYHFGKEKDPIIVGIGGWYRVGDSGIASMNAEYKRVRLGLSYDVTTSQLKQAPKTTGSFEISLIYTGLLGGDLDVGPMLVPCPRL